MNREHNNEFRAALTGRIQTDPFTILNDLTLSDQRERRITQALSYDEWLIRKLSLVSRETDVESGHDLRG